MKSREMKLNFMLLTICAVAIISLLSACQSRPPQIGIEAAKAELSPAIVGEAMVTMEINNLGGPDVLTGVRTDIPGAKASVHVMQGERMIPADTLRIPSRSNTSFKMGGSHVMIEDMPRTMKEGSKFNLIMTFQKSGEKQVTLVLQPAAAMPMEHDHQM